MSNERIDLKHYENKYTFETPPDPNWNGAPWTTADLKVILDELKKCYEKIDWLQQAADLTADFIGDIHHSYWDRFEERMYEAGLWKRPSEE